MHRYRTNSGRESERGVVILLVAIVLLFVVSAMAVLAIDLVSFYTARSEAQIAADGAALAAARVLANSGITSDPSDLTLKTNAEILAVTVAKQVATHNKVGGRNLVDDGTEVKVSFQSSGLGGGSNPRVTVQVTRNDLPTFFARIWGRTQITVTASAVAEAYNPSGLNASVGGGPPIAPVCVKPWVLPNLDPRNGNSIFDKTSGAISANPTTLLGWTDVGSGFPPKFAPACTNCLPPLPPATQWQFYPGDQLSFPAPTQALPVCNVPLTAYQHSIAGCVQTPIACNANVNIDTSVYPQRNSETADAINCLTHSVAGNGDRVDVSPPTQPFQFLAGNDNPVVGAQGKDVLVSDSLVTVPVYDSSVPISGTGTVQVIGFVQLFLNPDGQAALPSGQIYTTVVNLAGCGTNATGRPILGNGASPVAVRLIAP